MESLMTKSIPKTSLPPNKVTEEKDCVVFTRGPWIWFVAWVLWSCWCACTAAWFVQVQNDMTLMAKIVVAASGIASLIIAWIMLKRLIRSRARRPIIIVFDEKDKQRAGDDHYSCYAADIENCIVCERDGLKKSDPPLIQIWIKLRERHEALLVLEKGTEWRRQVMRQARRLADRWHVHIINNVTRESRVGFPVFGPTMALLGAALIMLGGSIVYKQVVLASWPTAEAVVLAYDAVLRSNTEQGNEPLITSPSVTFEYTVGAKTYRSTSTNPWAFYVSQSEISRDFAGVSPGFRTRCYYNAGDPGECYLFNLGVTPGPVVICAIGLILVVVTIWSRK